MSSAGAFRRLGDNAVAICCLVKPNAKLSAITDLSPSHVGVQLAAPPRDGEANEELLSCLSKVGSHRGVSLWGMGILLLLASPRLPPPPACAPTTHHPPPTRHHRRCCRPKSTTSP
jgi:hypothetical protein